ncbi:hypothetical protein TCAL_02867 [Tigriopus californicus]|uniref:Exonuclease domain-containing protein n=1 Tax=Tigriopus californicus TaxID=6832 RepID=A0A553NZ03_TIGCA|nr:uncharacterized protein LOC131886084 [Tigriopus californicus]TRY70658.1 hypothetical protein TCAL_02867 [Tigriopus californicus]|eukprot:TCALIF_02867-PA protein Name:"Similar to 44M2.3 Putative RNA exonuclease NEF-sp (Homo sapiens)" AED:0.07 eAED:0.07 QI:0/0/0/1/1/1/4/0/640
MELSKRDRRVASKKRKIAAFLDVAALNDQDESVQEKRLKRVHASHGGAIPPLLPLGASTHAKSGPPPLSDKPLLSGPAFDDLRRRLKERKKYLLTLPNFRLKSVGEDASLEVPPNLRTPLFMSDLHKLVTYMIMGNKMPYACESLRWCQLEKWNRLTHVNCVFIQGLSAQSFLDHRDANPEQSVSGMFPHKLEFISPAAYDSNMASEMVIIPVTKRRQDALRKLHKNSSGILKSGEAYKFYRSIFPIVPNPDSGKNKVNVLDTIAPEELKLHLLLNAEQMLGENYPMPLPGLRSDKLRDYVLSNDKYQEVSLESPMYSLDCEMCLTREGNELTRICVVDSDCKVVYHSLVKPQNEIVNYLTKYSGITKQMLVGVEKRLADVQNDLRDLLPANAIWVGQSLNSDLHAMKMMHPYVIDTSVIYNITGQRHRKTKLSMLSSLFLKEAIQTAGKQGHDPIEDAIAAMKLVNLKLENGYSFGDGLLGGRIPNLEEEYGRDQKAVDPVDPGEEGQPKACLITSVLDQAKKEKKKLQIVVQSELAQEYKDIPGNEDSIKETDGFKATLQEACDSVLNNQLTFCHLQVSDVAKPWKSVQKAVKKIWSHTSNNGIFITVLTGTKEENAMVGIALKRVQEDPSTDTPSSE